MSQYVELAIFFKESEGALYSKISRTLQVLVAINLKEFSKYCKKVKSYYLNCLS